MEASRAVRPRARRKSLRRLAPLGRKRSEQPEAEAFEQLYRKYAPEVYRYALALLSNPTDAEDVTQTTFLNAYRAFQGGERPRRPHNWLIAIAHNACRMRWRQASARPREVALEESPEPAAPGPEHERPSLDELLQALARLSFNQRAALVMRELEGRSYGEIAAVLGLSVGAVEALTFRARRGLRLHRRALGVLTTAPLPGSLASPLAVGGGAAAAGGAAFGADLALKAAAVVAAGAVTAGVGYRSVDAVVGLSRSEADAPQSRAIQPGGHTTAAATRHARRAHRPAAGRDRRRRAGSNERTGKPAVEPTAASRPTVAEQTAAPPPPPTPAQAVIATVAAAVPVRLPPPPPLPLPPPPPPPPPLQLPPLPVTVTTPAIPPPPQLP